MTKLRYFIAGLIAFLIQGIALSYAPQAKVIEVSMAQGVQSMQIQLLARAVSKPASQTNEESAHNTTHQEAAPNKVQESKLQEIAASAVEPKVVKPLPPKPVSQPVVKSKAIKPESIKPEPIKTKTEQTPVVATRAKDVTAKNKPNAATPPLSEKEPATKANNKPIDHAEKPQIEQHETTQQQIASQSSEPMLVSKPQFSAKPVPVSYPKLARRKGLEGKALIEVWLNSEGKQIKQKIILSSGHQILDQRALNTIKQWQFSRRIEQGQAIAHRVQIPINFKLQ
ncbi:TonB protein [Vibrio ichthyoenteri ATCC 700023]|uniref:TonB protein n=1 Tax=Vibrio ichthyoenteri ATCC 700023 TaxID=870968 RepID=F9RZB2_9VIBR|nr:energy transducer TonB [Vibrio ichthyoenteri]EGU45514.1 TonB protein [Vibrio ichthyoenteri ATCC 700023]